ncbi:MAG: sigma factor-like helix-turn-helix DNA-binding protein [Patescibacteria group bacterium]
MTDSILDKIIDQEHKTRQHSFDPESMLAEMLSILDDREREVIELRYGLVDGEKHTLEDIGKRFSITRERVRQIESSAIGKLKESEIFTNHAEVLVAIIEDLLENLGGLVAEERLLDKLVDMTASERAEAIIRFFMQKLLHDHFVQLKKSERMLKAWALQSTSVSKYEKLLNIVEQLLEELDDIIATDDLHGKVRAHSDVQDEEHVEEHVFENMLHLSSNIEHNPFGHWGYKHWPLIKPKRMNDKIYLVLKNHGKPLHFTDIAEKINETQFDHKKAHPATVHNELILDNDRYVLIGRGIYALKEWGYKAGVVTDIIEDVLRKQGPLSKDEIIEEVLKQRMVKKSTIALMLTNKDLFAKTADGQYELSAQKA